MERQGHIPEEGSHEEDTEIIGWHEEVDHGSPKHAPKSKPGTQVMNETLPPGCTVSRS